MKKRRTALPGPPDLWKSLQVGDRIRIVHLPTEFTKPPYKMHRTMRQLYQRLIDKKIIRKIASIDDLGWPWIDYAWPGWIGCGEWEGDSLALNHDGLRLISRKSRPRRRK